MTKPLGMLTTIGLLVPVMAVTVANSQNSLPQNSLPNLETVDSSSASDLSGVENRLVDLDYGLIFYPNSAGGERLPSNPTDYVAPLPPTKVNVSSFSFGQQTLPEYAIVKPNRPIETQTDPQRLTIVAPTTSEN